MISNPSIWGVAVEEINTLKPKTYVSGSIMNLFLLNEWYRMMEDTYCNFLDLFMMLSFSYPEPEEILRFRSDSGLFSSPQAQPPQKPVVFIICQHQHYFTTCFDYQLNHAWVFGRNINPQTPGVLHTNAGWEEWHGAMYWRKVAALFGWPVSKFNPVVTTYDFQQVTIIYSPLSDYHVAYFIDLVTEWN